MSSDHMQSHENGNHASKVEDAGCLVMESSALNKEKRTLAEELDGPPGDLTSEEGRENKRMKEANYKEEQLEMVCDVEEKESGRERDTLYAALNGETDEVEHHSDEKKGILEKIKEKLPGQKRKNEESPGSPGVEKKGILEKIKEKIPGCNKGTEETNEED